ncbi:hypothetical protein BCT84_15280 [Vibrio breoganii]|nr:hypothetical protein BCT84_15280 [Vibrio breoganii]
MRPAKNKRAISYWEFGDSDTGVSCSSVNPLSVFTECKRHLEMKREAESIATNHPHGAVSETPLRQRGNTDTTSRLVRNAGTGRAGDTESACSGAPTTELGDSHLQGEKNTGSISLSPDK